MSTEGDRTLRSNPTPEELYLDLLKRCLTRYGFDERFSVVDPAHGTMRRRLVVGARRALAKRNMELVRHAPFDPRLRELGLDWPASAETMIGLRRLDNIQECVEDVLRQDVPGDLIETGVWRGGATIFMRGVLKARGVTDRTVWAADSFAGLPRPSGEHSADEGDSHWKRPELAVSFDEVKENFERYGLLDDQVRFLVGWFEDTLPTAPIERLAVLRLDGDMYGSTITALRSLYPKLSVGGYVIVDDYESVAGCKQAVEDFRTEHGIDDEIADIDGTAVFWKRRR